MMIGGRIKKALIVGATLFGALAMVGTDMNWLSGFTSEEEAPSEAPTCRSVSECDRRCVKGDGVSCYYGGLGRLQGATGKPDPVGASVLFGRSCDAGTAQGCTLLATLHERGTGVARDAAKAQALFQQACAGGDPQGCKGVSRVSGAPAKSPATPPTTSP